MFESKKNNVSIFVERCALVGDAAVSLGFKAKINACVLGKLKGSACCGMLRDTQADECPQIAWPIGAEETVCCYAVYLAVAGALCGDPLATMKSKVAAVSCGTNDAHFFITWKVKGTVSAVRKSLGIAMKQISPAKYFSSYARCVKDFDIKPDRAAFNYAVDELNHSLKDSIHCGVVGNIRANQESVNAMCEIIAGKVSIKAADTPKTKPALHFACDHSHCTEVKTSGWEADVIKDYINAKLPGICCVIGDKKILVGMAAAQFKTAAAKLKKLADGYVAAKYEKLGDNLAGIMGYAMIANADVCSADVRDLIKKKVTASMARSAIKQAL